MLKIFKNLRVMWIIVTLGVIALGSVTVMLFQKKSDEEVPSANCLSRGTGVYTELSLSELISDSAVIAVVKVNGIREDGNVAVAIQNQLKGSINEDTINLCSEYTDLKLHEKLLVFLEGRDEKSHAWLATYGGIKPHMGNNNYTIQGKSYSLDEIRKAIKKQN